MHVIIQSVTASKEAMHWSMEQYVKRRQKILVKAKVGQRVKPIACWTGNWNMATLRVAPIKLVHIATRQPMILAARLEDRKTCRKIDRPICANIHPKRTTANTPKLVNLKKLIYRKKYPNPQKTKLVARLMQRLQRKLMAQQLIILMPFILIICISFSYFQRTTRQRNTGRRRLRASGKIMVAMVLMSMSMKTEPQDQKGRYVQPEAIVLFVVCFMQALEIISITVKRPSGIMKQGVYLAVQFTSIFIWISVMPFGRQKRNYRTSFTLSVAFSIVLLAVWKRAAPSGRCWAVLVCLREQKVSLLRNQQRLKRS